MNAEILAVGSELLTPQRMDTNSLWLTSQLNELGVEVVAKAIVGDDRGRLAEFFGASLKRSDIVILTGGLGPTEDDVTRDAVAPALGRSQTLRQDLCEAIAERFARMKRSMAENNKRQAYLIDGAEALPNERGTAPGQWLRLETGQAVTLLPGPPNELKGMWEAQVLKRLKAMLPALHIAKHWYRVAGLGESDLDQLIAPVYTRYSNPVTTILAKPGDVEIHLRARAANSAEAEALVEEVAAPIRQLLGDRIYSSDGADLETSVGRMLRERGETVAVAESMTGGLLGERITSVAGSSDYFAGGLLAYYDAMKQALLGVPAQLLEAHTAVSAEAAIAMAQGARERTGATHALSVTGYAGPSDANAGAVYIGYANATGAESRELHFLGDRARVRNLAATTALDFLRRRLLAL